MLKQSLAVVIGALLLSWVFAQDVELRSDHPDTYVVVKGDTLWDISARFLQRPWLWPEIWQANPQIENPHLIYPGDVISLVYVDGQPRLSVSRDLPGGTVRLSPHVRAERLDTPITSVPLEEVRPFLERNRLVSEEDFSTLPYIVALEDGHLLGMNGQLAYVRGLGHAQQGDQFTIMRPAHVYRDVPDGYPWAGRPKVVTADEWNVSDSRSLTAYGAAHSVFKNRAYHAHVRVLGYEVYEVGTAVVTRAGEPASLLITHGSVEAKAGDVLLPPDDQEFDVNFFPSAPDSVPDNTVVLAFTASSAIAGPTEVIAINKGRRNGIANGQVFSIFTPGEVIRDQVAHPYNDLRAAVRPSRAQVQLPDEFVGHAMVFRTFDAVSYALIMDGHREVKLYDILREPMN